MAFTIYYPTSCDEIEVEHYCDECAAIENGRIRSVFFMKTGFEFTDASNAAEWTAAIEDGDVVVIPATNGSSDGGTPNYGVGHGDQEQKYLNSTYKITYRDPNYKGNCDFYEGKKRSSQWKFGYRTSTLVHIGDATVTVAPKAPVADDLKSVVEWEVEVTWTSANYPCPVDMPEGIFECFLTDEIGN